MAETPRTLFERVRHGDSRAWEQVVELYGPLVYHWCRQAGLPAGDAAAAVRSLFQDALQSLAVQSLDASAFRCLLRDQTSRMLLAAGRRPVPESVAVSETSLSYAVALSESGVDGSAPESVHAALSALRDQGDVDEITWQAFWKSTIGRSSPAEVARELNVSIDVVHRARASLLRRLRRTLNAPGQ